MISEQFAKIVRDDRRKLIERAVDELGIDLHDLEEVRFQLKGWGHWPTDEVLKADIAVVARKKQGRFTIDEIKKLLEVVEGDVGKLTQILEIMGRV